MENYMIEIDNVTKRYKLGQIGGATLREELQRKWAVKMGKEDPTKKIGAKSYVDGEEFWALNGVSFKVKKGERVGIIGHNGAGKSTLLKLLSRVTAPTTGEIGLDGRVTSMLEVGTGFHGELTGRENIYMNGAILGMTKKEIDKKIDDIIEFSECGQFIDTPVKRYSSGMYVKLAFSVAAHLDSEIMIMDEVLAVGDMAFQKKCLDKMNDVSRKEGRTILYVSHNMNTIRQLCDRVVVLDHGKQIFDGDVEKGIIVYLGKKNELSCHINFKDRVRESWASIDNVEIICLDVDDRNEAVYKIGEKLNAKIIVFGKNDLDQVQLRVVMKDEEGNPVTMAMTRESFCIKNGKNTEILFSFDISKVAPGSYNIGLLLYRPTGYGAYEDLDGIPAAYCFDIQSDKDFNQNIPWRKRMWGYFYSDELSVSVR